MVVVELGSCVVEVDLEYMYGKRLNKVYTLVCAGHE
jgi:hypothetical protein